MGSSTSPDSLYKPTVGEEGWGNAVNANMDTIQAELTSLRTSVEELQVPDSKGHQLLSAQFGLSLTVANTTNKHDCDLAGTTDYHYDPMAAIQSGVYHSTYLSGEDFAAGTWFKLPAGVWLVETGGYWDGNTSGDRITEAIHIDSRLMLAGDEINPLFGSPNQWQMMSNAVYNKAAALPSNASAGTLAVFIITPEMIAASHADSPAGSDWALGFQIWQDSGSQRTLTGFSLVVARIGAA